MDNPTTETKVVAVRMPQAMLDFVKADTGVTKDATAVFAFVNKRMTDGATLTAQEAV